MSGLLGKCVGTGRGNEQRGNYVSLKHLVGKRESSKESGREDLAISVCLSAKEVMEGNRILSYQKGAETIQ